jgi:hypothetical protein
MRLAISSRTAAFWRSLKSGSVRGVMVYSTASVATDSRIASYSRVPTAARTAGWMTPLARSTAGRSESWIKSRMRSERGPCSSSSPMFWIVITSSETMSA